MSKTKEKLDEAKALLCRVSQCSKQLQISGYTENGKPLYMKTCAKHHVGQIGKLV